jgi:hypothetical protein
VACILSGARGAWIALPVLLLLFLSCRHLLHPQVVLKGGACIVALFAILYIVPQTHVRARLASAYAQLGINVSDVDEGLPSSGAPICMQDAQLLEVWAAMARQRSESQVDIRVTTDYVPTGGGSAWPGCKERGALLLQNLGRHVAWLKLPHSARYGAKSADLHLLASGDAYFKFGDGRRVRFRTKPGKFKTIELHTNVGTRGFFTVVLLKGWRLWLVPVETYPGEFRYTLAESSVGERLEMWGVARRLFETAPLTGVGTGAYMASARQLVDADQAPPITAQYDHPHNELLDALSSRGLVGLAALLLLIGVPAGLFIRGLSSHVPVRMGASLAGLLVSVGFFLFGLSETMLVHSIALGWYVIMTALFLVISEGPQGRGAELERDDDAR